MKILLVEDSTEFQKIIVATLAYHSVTCAGSAEEAMMAIGERDFELILLDIKLPGRDGYSLLSELQSDPRTNDIPVICLTGQKDVTDKVTAFSLGADDYIVKPFDPVELKARVDGKLKKTTRAKENSSLRKVGVFELDHLNHRVTLRLEAGSEELSLTQTEFKLLSCLTQHPEQVYSRHQLLRSAWGEHTNVLDRAIDVHLCSLRKKLGEYSYCIKAVPGIGYKFSEQRAVKKKAS